MSPENFFAWAKERLTDIKNIYDSKEEVIQTKIKLQSAHYKSAKIIKGIRTYHCYLPQSPNMLRVKTNSKSKNFRTIKPEKQKLK